MTSPGASSLARAGVSQSTTAPWTLTEDIEVFEDAGWGAVGIWLHKLERPTMDEFWFPETRIADAIVAPVVDRLRASGLTVSHVALAGRFVEPDEGLRERRLEHALHALAIADRLEGKCLVIIPGRLNGLRAEQAMDTAVNGLTELIERTDGNPVPLAIEPVKEVDFVTTLDAALDLVDRVGHPRVGVYVDLFQLWRDAGLVEAIARSEGRIAGVHVADSAGLEGDTSRLPPGEGVIPLHELMAAVEAAGYRGSYDVELFTMTETPQAAGELLERSAVGMRELIGSIS
jgi:sugar phosphate isomerase/epimerase